MKSPGWQHLLENRLVEAQTCFREQGGAEGLLSLGLSAVTRGVFQELWEPWSELIERYPEHWAAAAVVPLLVSAGGGLEGQGALDTLLRQVSSRASSELRSLVADLLEPARPLNWLGCPGDGRFRWRKLMVEADPSVCGLAQIARGSFQTCYASTTLLSESRVATYLECDPMESSVRIWLNGALVLRARRHSLMEWMGMPFRVPVQLESGENSLWVEASRTKWGEKAFRLKLGIQELVSLPNVYPQPSDGERPSDVPTIFRRIPKAWWMLRAEYLFRMGDRERAQKILDRWQARYPDSVLVAWAQNQTLLSSTSESWSRLCQEFPAFAPVERAEGERFLDAGRLLPAYLTEHWAHFYKSRTGQRLMDTFRDHVAQATEWLDRLDEVYPSHPWLLERRLDLLTPYPPVKAKYLDGEKLLLAIQLMEGLAKTHPNCEGWEYRRLARCCQRAGLQKKALIYARRAVQYSPRRSYAWSLLGDYESTPGRAVSAYQRALRFAPNRVHLRDEIHQSLGEPPLLDRLAPAEPWQPPWESQEVRPLWQHDVGFVDICDSRIPALRSLVQELRLIVYSDGACFGEFRDVSETPETGVFCPDLPDWLDRSQFRLSPQDAIIYHQNGEAEDMLDFCQGIWSPFLYCRAGDVTDSTWMVNWAGSGDGFQHQFELTAPQRCVLAYPRAVTMLASRPADQTTVHDDWQTDCWTSPGPLSIRQLQAV